MRDLPYTLADSQSQRRLAKLAGSQAGLISMTHADMASFPPPPDAFAAFRTAVENAVEVFTPFHGSKAARSLLAPRLSRFLGVDVDGDQELAITPGTQNALFGALAVLIDRGDTVLLADPDYMSSAPMIRFLGGRVNYIPVAAKDSGFEMNLEAVEHGFKHGAKVLLFSHPCNPTGAVYKRSMLRDLAELACAYEAHVVVDELYSRLVYDVPFAHLIAEHGMKSRCITVLGVSKTESMSGYRVGCLIAPPAIIDDVGQIIEVTALRASGYAQCSLQNWLEGDEAFVQDRVDRLRGLRDITVGFLSSLECVDITQPLGTAYVFPRLRGILDNDFEVAESLVREARILVDPGCSFGPTGTGGFRLCFAQDEQNLMGLLQRVGEVLTRLSQKPKGQRLP